MKRSGLLTFVYCLLICGIAEVALAESPQRNWAGLLAFYNFSDTSGAVVRDRSGVGQPIDLTIADPTAVRRAEGSLTVVGETLIRSERPPKRLIETIRRTGAITIEAWLRPAATNQTGPARIVTLSRNGTNRNFTLGQDGDKFDVRLRTTDTSDNGLPSLGAPKGSVTTRLTHVVYTRLRSGRVRLYINGQRQAEGQVAGRMSNWDSYKIGLANEQDKSRPWKGTYYLVAIYGRGLSEADVKQNFDAGAETPTTLPEQQPDHRLAHFETKIAPLLANHCLECHDAAAAKGDLDLSKKLAAFQGGESGEAIVAGKSGESLLWELVEADEMPHDRTPLSKLQKQLLQDWIDDGAVWSLARIDPAVYTHAGGTDQNWVRRLTVSEYIETVRSATGVDISKEALELLPPDLRADGFSNTAYNLSVDLRHVNAYAQLAETIVGRMDVAAFALRFSKSQKFTDDEMGKLISKMGKWLLRGPVENDDIISYRGISTSVAAAGGGFEEAVGLIIEAMLQSPRFLYRMEDQLGPGGKVPVTEYELASRMSYIVWGGPPDRELMKAADNGSLLDDEELDRQLQRMLADSRAVAQSEQFIADWLNLERLKNLRPSSEKYPNWNPSLAQAMRQETLAFFHDVVWKQQRPLADLLNAQVTFVTPALAEHYGLKPSGDGSSSNDLARYDLSRTPGRGGLLTQGSLLTIGGDDASMVTRGLLVMHELLRGVVKDPPPCVDTTPPPTEPGRSQRAIAMGRIQNANCGGCHSKFEPLAFGLERFDGLGSYHERDEHGNQLRDDGQILFPGDAKPIKYQSSAELMDLLAGSDRVKLSITWKLTQFALGRPLGATDAAEVGRIHQAASQAGGKYTDLITAIVKSDLVRMVRTQQTE